MICTAIDSQVKLTLAIFTHYLNDHNEWRHFKLFLLNTYLTWEKIEVWLILDHISW